MPKVERRAVSRRTQLPRWLTHLLETGKHRTFDGDLSVARRMRPEDVKRVWSSIRDWYLPEYQEQHPGETPWAETL